MTSASSTSAKSLFADSKARLADRVKMNVNNIASLARQINRGSKSNETLMYVVRNFVVQETAIANTEANLKKLQLISSHLDYQLDILLKNCQKLEDVKEQVTSMQR